MKISKHYTLDDVEYNELAIRLDIDNSLPKSLVDKASCLAENLLDPLKERFPHMVLTSWYRSEKLEKVYSRQDFAEWCFYTNNPISSRSWVVFLARRRHITARAVTIAYDEQIVEAIRNMQYTHLKAKKWISVSYEPSKLDRLETTDD